MAYCATCNQRHLSKRKLPNGLFANQGGELWLGAMCPRCSRAVLQHKKVDLTVRYCRICNVALPRTRYFNCYKCVLSRYAQPESYLSGSTSDPVCETNEIEGEGYLSS